MCDAPEPSELSCMSSLERADGQIELRHIPGQLGGPPRPVWPQYGLCRHSVTVTLLKWR